MNAHRHILLAACVGVVVVGAADLGGALSEEEIGLFNRNGMATAYIAADKTVYLWEGLPVAYLHGEMVYGFNGRHLGWYVNNAMHDLNGKRVGAPTGGIEPAKGAKQAKPAQGAREAVHARPIFSSEWSQTDFDAFLRGGRL